MNYDRYGPCDQEGVQQRSDVRPFAFDRTEDRIHEQGSYVLRRSTDAGRSDAGVGRYEVVWVRDADGAWKIQRLGQ